MIVHLCCTTFYQEKQVQNRVTSSLGCSRGRTRRNPNPPHLPPPRGWAGAATNHRQPLLHHNHHTSSSVTSNQQPHNGSDSENRQRCCALCSPSSNTLPFHLEVLKSRQFKKMQGTCQCKVTHLFLLFFYYYFNIFPRYILIFLLQSKLRSLWQTSNLPANFKLTIKEMTRI